MIDANYKRANEERAKEKGDLDHRNILDPDTLVAIKHKIQEIKDKLAELPLTGSPDDNGERDRLEEQRKTLEKELRRNTTPKGKSRKFPDEAEKARVNVKRAISTAIENVKEVHIELGAYLDNNIQTGITCRYNDISTRWGIST